MQCTPLENEIFAIKTKADFQKVALKVFHFQRENCMVYGEYITRLKKTDPKSVKEIPFLPISFFKTHLVISRNLPIQFEFLSSGTTGTIRSKHAVQRLEMYERSFTHIFKNAVSTPSETVILALLPNYQQQGNSSLIYMVDQLIKQTTSPLSGFFLNEYEELISNYKEALQIGKKVILFGVSYALLDLAEKKMDLSEAHIIETGGMKGRRKEMTKEDMYQHLKQGLNCTKISSEYGMTELFSQSYSNQDGLFDLPRWMEVKVRDVNDPFHYVQQGKTGGLNVIDLANLYSCSFLATQDLGRREGNHFRLMGRFDNSDIRGCNLLMD
jgi:hypothetical protein